MPIQHAQLAKTVSDCAAHTSMTGVTGSHRQLDNFQQLLMAEKKAWCVPGIALLARR